MGIKKYNIADLLSIMARLRGKDGCPWDREQSHSSIRKDLLEEAYEVADAIDRSDSVDLCEELGDLLLQVVFHSQIAVESGEFDFDDVCDGICKKLILRHPHVFGDVKVENSAQVLDNWDAIKKEEKHQQSATDTLKSVPAAFPAAMRAQKVQKRAAKAADALNDTPEVASARLRMAIKGGKDSIGDMLFAAIALARACGVDAEEQLQAATDRFTERFAAAEAEKGEEIARISSAEAERIWSRK
ncbi:MAG: nucleoside triphosphate pyrophosphohydrolase [Clostridia bacterium]|nr:nucleoside triphosphate pyrophosphohydrolase [Clostridia bacterium]